jgi:hypothetical protein
MKFATRGHRDEIGPAHSAAMKAVAHRSAEPALQRTEAALHTHVQKLFARFPMLGGFVIAHDFDVTHVAIQTWPDYIAGDDLRTEIAQAFVDLAEERPDTIERFQGRTFARNFH